MLCFRLADRCIFFSIISICCLFTNCLQISATDERVCGEWVGAKIYQNSKLDIRQVKHIHLHLAENGAYEFSSFQGQKEKGSYHFSKDNDKLFLRPNSRLTSYYLEVKKLENDSLTLKMNHNGDDILAVFAKKTIDRK